MRRVTVLMSAAALALSTVSAYAQAKPNFAGKWTQVVDASAPAPAAGGRGRGGGGMAGFGAAPTITQDDKTLTIVQTGGPNGDMKSVYNLDGSDSHNSLSFGGNNMDLVSKAKWDGTKLAISTTFDMGNGGNPVTTTRSLSLDASGNLIVESTGMGGGRGGGAPTTTKVTYKKG